MFVRNKPGFQPIGNTNRLVGLTGRFSNVRPGYSHSGEQRLYFLGETQFMRLFRNWTGRRVMGKVPGMQRSETIDKQCKRKNEKEKKASDYFHDWKVFFNSDVNGFCCDKDFLNPNFAPRLQIGPLHQSLRLCNSLVLKVEIKTRVNG